MGSRRMAVPPFYTSAQEVFMLIKNGFITDPASQRSYAGDIRIENGVIQKISADITPAPEEEIIDAAGLTVSPGLIDTHVHFRDPGFTHKENLHTGALAAAKGGFTSVICMANTSPVVDSVPVLFFSARSPRISASIRQLLSPIL